MLSDPEAMRFYPAPYTPEQVDAWIRWAMASQERDGFALWVMVRRSHGRVIGDCGITLQPIAGRVIPEIGYHVVRSEWGRGYATEAARACRDWLFARTDRDEVCSIVDPANVASRRVAERVHAAMTELDWVERTGKRVCLYLTSREQARAGTTLAG